MKKFRCWFPNKTERKLIKEHGIGKGGYKKKFSLLLNAELTAETENVCCRKSAFPPEFPYPFSQRGLTQRRFK